MGSPSTRTTGDDSVEGLVSGRARPNKPEMVGLDQTVRNGRQNDPLDRRAR